MKERIFNLMKELGMSQKTFASEICIAEGSLSSIYNGRTKPTLNVVNNIHERFPEVDTNWLMFGTGTMFLPGTSERQQQSPEFNFPEQGHVAQPSVETPHPPAGLPLQAAFADQFHAPSAAAPLSALISDQVKNPDKPQRRISEIRVFYDDGTFETFPAGK